MYRQTWDKRERGIDNFALNVFVYTKFVSQTRIEENPQKPLKVKPNTKNQTVRPININK